MRRLLLFAVAVLTLALGFMSQAGAETASWYGPGLYGNPTACPVSDGGDASLDPGSWLVASTTYPCGTLLDITYGGQTVTAPVGDSGPYVAGRDIDLGPGVASALGFESVGVGEVAISVAGANASASPDPAPQPRPEPRPDPRPVRPDPRPVPFRGGEVYVVQYGDTLTGIAATLGVGLNHLIAANPEIVDPNLIFVGDRVNY